jgi:threonine/homoserine/homoserine lactone efflux protein
MEDVVSTVGLWGCAVLAVVAIGWGVAVLVTGRAPQRELRQYASVAHYGRFCIGFGVVFGLFALGNGLGGWFSLLTAVGFVLLVWMVLRNRRTVRRTVQQREAPGASTLPTRSEPPSAG